MEIERFKIGILINSNYSLFSNGIIQNAYFLHECLESAGFVCEFLCPEKNPKEFAYKHISLKTISTDKLLFKATDYKLIITVTTGLTPEEYAMFKDSNIRVVGLICGNQYVVDQECFIRGSSDNSFHFIGKQNNVDELWLIPQFHYSLEYVQIIRNKPVYMVPHLWSPKIVVNELLRKNKAIIELEYNPTIHKSSSIEIYIVEPNIGLYKTALVPLLAAEKINVSKDEDITNVHLYNCPQNNHTDLILGNMTIYKHIRKYGRIAISDILLECNKRNTIPIFVCHQLLHSLNYLYYELLYFGYPFVHNSPELEKFGYYYPNNDISKCAEMIRYAATHHNKHISTYLDLSRKWIHDNISSDNSVIQQKFKDMAMSNITIH